MQSLVSAGKQLRLERHCFAAVVHRTPAAAAHSSSTSSDSKGWVKDSSNSSKKWLSRPSSSLALPVWPLRVRVVMAMASVEAGADQGKLSSQSKDKKVHQLVKV